MNPFEMVVLIVAIVMVTSVFRAKYRSQSESGPGRLADDPDTARLRDEVRALRERVAVLERIATDANPSAELDREIEKLRNRD